MKKIYRTPSIHIIPLSSDVNILSSSDPSTNRDANVGQDGTIGYGGSSSGGGGTRVKRYTYIIDDSEDEEYWDD